MNETKQCEHWSVLSDAGNRVRRCGDEYVFHYPQTGDKYCRNCGGLIILIGRDGKEETAKP
jgi:hypothetical protein